MTPDALMNRLTQYGADIDGILERFMGDTELYQSCFRQFVEDDSFAQLRRAVEAADSKRAFEAAHTLKGTAGNMGLTPIYQLLCETVEELRAGRYDGIPELQVRIDDEQTLLKTLV